MSTRIRDQVAAVRAEIEQRPPGLVRHVQRVLIEARDLAERWDVDPERIELATWGHDLFRSFKREDLVRFASESGVPVSQEDEANPVLLHGPIASVVLVERFGIDDADVIAAVRDHTLGSAEMSTIAKIILLADKFESSKRERTPAMKAIRQTARKDLDLALLAWADWRWVENRSRGWSSHASFWAGRERWVPEHHFELSRNLPERTADDGWYAAAEAREPTPDRRTLEERRAARGEG